MTEGEKAWFEDRFIISPAAICCDHELTSMELRILLGLLSFRSSSTTNTVWPKRETLRQRTGYSLNAVSRSISRLVDKGWLSRSQHRGPNTYEVHVPDRLRQQETVADPETVAYSETVADPATVSDPATVADPATETVADPATPKEIIEETRSLKTVFLTKNIKSDDQRERDIKTVFAHWKTVNDKDYKHRLTGKRRGKINARLEDGYTPAELMRAIDGNAASDWHRGKNPQGVRYNELEFILRDTAKVDFFIEIANGKRQRDRELADFLAGEDVIEGECSHVDI
jgi:hypothetical protein